MNTEWVEITTFLQELKKRRASPNTLKNYDADLRTFMSWLNRTEASACQADEVSSSHIRRYQSYQLKDLSLRPATVNRRISSLRSFFEWAKGQGMIADNPAEKIPYLRTKHSRPRILSAEQLDQISYQAERDALKGLHQGRRNLAIVQMLRFTGVNVSELCDLMLDDMRLDGRRSRITVRNAKFRVIPLRREPQRALEAYLSVRADSGSRYTFPGRLGPIGSQTVQRLVAKYALRAGIDSVTPRILRHSFGQQLLDGGADPATVAALMGKSTINSVGAFAIPSHQQLSEAIAQLSS